MAARDYESAPVAEALGLHEVIKGLADDLRDMRDKKISPQDGIARAAIAKQLFNGVRLYLQAMQMLERQARPINEPPAAIETTTSPSGAETAEEIEP